MRLSYVLEEFINLLPPLLGVRLGTRYDSPVKNGSDVINNLTEKTKQNETYNELMVIPYTPQEEAYLN